MEHDIHIRFLSQEAFVDLVLLGLETVYYPGDPRINDHPGLLFLSSIGFKWPVVDTQRGNSRLENFDGEDHDLAIKYGYSVRQGVSILERRKALEAGVKALGLQEVADHIVGLIRRNRGNTIMQRAVPRWKQDLLWLYETKYLNSLHSFEWPSAE